MKQIQDYVKSVAESIEEVASDPDALNKYFDDALDIEFTVDARGDYRGARIAITLGGPNVYFNTRKGCVEGYWGFDKAEWAVESSAIDAVDAYFSEMWEMARI